MNRLALCVELRQEARINGTGPTTTVSQTGELKKVVDWIDKAYEAIQNEHETWQFLRTAFSVSLSSGTSEYTPTALSITNLARWITDDVRLYLTATGTTDEQEIFFEEWDDFRRTYLFGSARDQTGRPTCFTIKPDDSIVFWPEPDAAYTVVGEYYRMAYDWSADVNPNTVTPLFPTQFHRAILWRALMYYGADYGEWDKYEHGQNEYKDIMAKLEFDQLPRIGWGQPLA